MNQSEHEKRLQFEALVVEHHVRLRAFVRSLAVDPDWVDDLAQEAFLTAYRQWETYDPARDFGKWLRGIAANIVRNELRKDARRRRILHTDLAEVLLRRYTESRVSTAPLTTDKIRECLDQLEPQGRAIVQGRYTEGLCASELAERLELTAENVRQMLVRIRRQIRQCVECHTVGEM